MTFEDFVVRYTVVDKRDRVVPKEKSFKSAVLRRRFLDKLDEQGKLVEVLAFSDPQGA